MVVVDRKIAILSSNEKGHPGRGGGGSLGDLDEECPLRFETLFVIFKKDVVEGRSSQTSYQGHSNFSTRCSPGNHDDPIRFIHSLHSFVPLSKISIHI